MKGHILVSALHAITAVFFGVCVVFSLHSENTLNTVLCSILVLLNAAFSIFNYVKYKKTKNIEQTDNQKNEIYNLSSSYYLFAAVLDGILAASAVIFAVQSEITFNVFLFFTIALTNVGLMIFSYMQYKKTKNVEQLSNV